MSDHLEYLFFTRDIADQFIQTLKSKHLPWQETQEPVHNSIVIQIPEDDISDYWDEIDDLYDDLALEDQQRLEQGNENKDMSTAGVYIQLQQGKQTVAQVNPDVLGRILEVVSSNEFSEFIDTIVKSVEKPDDTAICQR